MQGDKLTRNARIAVVGCGHGGLDTIYVDLAVRCQSRGWDISELDLLIICGDVQVNEIVQTIREIRIVD